MQNLRIKCPVCNSALSNKFFDGGKKTLATLGWPDSSEDAIKMRKYDLYYTECASCSHIWNQYFEFKAVPYEINPNRMFNSGKKWNSFVEGSLSKLKSFIPGKPTVVDIGCGEGHFVRRLKKICENKGRFIGFDPNTTEETGLGIEFSPSYFDPLKDVEKLRPDLLIMRHVLEHLEEPAVFLEQLAFAASKLDKTIYFFAETPCVDNAVKYNRVVDFFYEHPSQFTKRSFYELMKIGGEVKWLEVNFGGEIVNGLIELKLKKRDILKNKLDFDTITTNNTAKLQEKFSELAKSGKKVAIWGGTGKAATFIQHYGLDKKRFPYVVDSDIEKVGTFVPGSGQVIKHSLELKTDYVDVIVIATQWRSADIYSEIKKERIQFKEILIEHLGNLINFLSESHPYS